MEKTKTIIQTILILVIWYCFYSVGGWKPLGFDGGKMNLLLLLGLYVLPMILIGIVLNGFTCICNIKGKRPIQRLNLLIEGVFILILVIVPIIVMQKFPIYDVFMETMQPAIYQELIKFSDIFGMGAYMATGLCAGHMVGALSEKPQKAIIKYGSIIFVWFIAYDLLLPMTEAMTKSGRNYTISTLLTILPMLFAGIVLTYRGRDKFEQKQVDKFYFILFIIATVAALIIPTVSILLDLKIPVYESQNLIVSMVQFIQGNMLYIILWLCVGGLVTKLKQKS